MEATVAMVVVMEATEVTAVTELMVAMDTTEVTKATDTMGTVIMGAMTIAEKMMIITRTNHLSTLKLNTKKIMTIGL